jgi:hypothetical protein
LTSALYYICDYPLTHEAQLLDTSRYRIDLVVRRRQDLYDLGLFG